MVGAGFTGLSTALHLVRQGVSVVVVEAKEVGWGGSGRAFGQVVPYAKHDEKHILSTYGSEQGERLIALLASGPELVYGLIEQHKIRCEPVRQGLLFAAHSEASRKRLNERARFWQDRSQPVELLEGADLEKVVGSSYYSAALIDFRGGCINPLAYARGLAHAVVEAGARLFESSPATKLTREGKSWLLTAGGGAVVAANVILATDAYTDGLWPGLRRAIVPIRAYHLMSAPISDNLRRSILPGGQSLTDSRRLYSGIRVRPDGRIHMSADGPPFSNRGKPFEKMATKRVRDLFPQVDALTWEEGVSGWVGVSADQYPRLYRLADGVLGAVGLSGRGIAFGTLLGGEIARRVLQRPEQECALPLTPFRPLAAPNLLRMAVFALINTYRVMDHRELNSGYLRPGK